jgi:transposase
LLLEILYFCIIRFSKRFFMQKRDYTTGLEISNRRWKTPASLLPEPQRSEKGGQHPAPNRACFEGLLWLLRSGARYKDIPQHFPSGSTCWRRLKWWHEQGALLAAWQSILGMLDAKGRLKLEEFLRMDRFYPQKKGRSGRQNKKRQRDENNGTGRWSWYSARIVDGIGIGA